MKILAINGSPRKGGNTEKMLRTVLEVCSAGGLETTFFQAGGREVQGCKACGGCGKHKGACVQKDWVNDLYPQMKAADALLLGTPTYFFDLTPEIKAIIDRTGFISRHDGFAFNRKVAAAVAAVRRAGSIHALDSIQHFFLINGMIVPGSSYLNMSLALAPGDVEKDAEGLQTMRDLGDNLVWLLKKIKA
ncbi:MAG: flavodoxin family protein [Treponema sp.]|jgi:multimeric flavodoxin WrbA|nr:flavodoxin family protein [Treponema sp.]